MTSLCVLLIGTIGGMVAALITSSPVVQTVIVFVIIAMTIWGMFCLACHSSRKLDRGDEL